MRVVPCWAVLSLIYLSVVCSPAQTASSASVIAIPSATGVLGQKDPAALAELIAHQAAVGSVPWVGMQGTGKITFGSQDPTQYDATLSNLGADKFRLDSSTDKGPVSVRMERGVGKTQGDDSLTSTIPADVAFTGLFPFEFLRVAHLAELRNSLLDHGTVLIDGAELHRVTLETGSFGRNPITKTQQTVAVDFYFNPATHLLAKSVSYVPLTNGQRAKFLIVITYADYRKVGEVLIPFRYTETIDGQQSRSLQLSNIQLNPTLDTTYFEF